MSIMSKETNDKASFSRVSSNSYSSIQDVSYAVLLFSVVKFFVIVSKDMFQNGMY